MHLLLLLLGLAAAHGSGCADWEKGACVCTSTSCDSVEPIGPIIVGEAAVYISAGGTTSRLQRSVINTTSSEVHTKPITEVFLNISRRDQSIVGFGGAFTDAAATNLYSVSKATQSELMRSYFGEGGLGYTLGRVPMAACDFSSDEYSYDDSDGDFALTNFSLSHDVQSGRLAFIQQAIAMIKENDGANLTLFASPWSPPAWMKTNNNRVGGTLKGSPGDQYHQTWAEYFVKFVSAFAENNIPIWAVTVQNEPQARVVWDSCRFDAETERDFIKMDLGPKLKAAHPNVKILMLDDQFREIETWAKVIMGDPEAAKYVDGIGFHWYLDFDMEVNWYHYVSDAHKTYPKLLLLPTEACEGYLPWSMHPKIGDWTRGKRYAHDIIQDLRHGAVGWTDWNLFLDTNGGPNHAKNFVDAPIIVDAKNDRFYKQPMYYVMGHFSRFIRPGYTRIDTSATSDTVENVAFISEQDSEVVVVLHNQHSHDTEVVKLHSPAGVFFVEMQPDSIATVVIPLQ